MRFSEGDLVFEFNNSAIKLDDTKFYRDRFERLKNGLKAVDFVTWCDSDLYFIEVKDYSKPDTTPSKSDEFIDSIIDKVIHSLAILFPFSISNYDDKDILKEFLSKNRLFLILEIKKPLHPNRNLPQSKNEYWSNIIQKLNSKLKTHLSIRVLYNKEVCWIVE